MQLKMKIQLFTPRPLQGLSWDLGKRARKSDVAPDFFLFLLDICNHKSNLSSISIKLYQPWDKSFKKTVLFFYWKWLVSKQLDACPASVSTSVNSYDQLLISSQCVEIYNHLCFSPWIPFTEPIAVGLLCSHGIREWNCCSTKKL
jgi:hypothetical protein